MDSGRLAPMVREVRRLAVERPDFVYGDQPERPDTPVCYYYGADGEGNGVGCILGEAAKALGASSETLMQMDKTIPFMDTLRLAIHRPRFTDLTRGENNAFRWLDLTQAYQDAGMSWSEAVEKSDLLANEPVLA